MEKWCGIKKSSKSERYRVIVPMIGDLYIDDDMMINDDVSGKILTKWLSLDEAKEACKAFNMLHKKYN